MLFINHNCLLKAITYLIGNGFSENETSQNPDDSVKGNQNVIALSLSTVLYKYTGIKQKSINLFISFFVADDESTSLHTRPPNAKDYLWPNADEKKSGITLNHDQTYII